MANDNTNEKTNPSETQPRKSKKGVETNSNKSKVISVFVGVSVLMIALFQVSRISQRELQLLQWEAVRMQYQQKMAFREKAERRRFDTIENYRQADILESRFKPINHALLTSVDNKSIRQ